MLGKTIISDNVTPIINSINSYPTPLSKKIFRENYYGDNSLERIEIFEDEEKICLVKRGYKLLYNTKCIALPKKVNGITYCKKTKKIKCWIGTTITSLPIHHLFSYLNIDWLDKLSTYENYQNISKNKILTTKTIIERIISGKISNPRLLIKEYIKISVKYDYNWKLVRELLNNSHIISSSTNITSILINISKYTVNPNESLQILLLLNSYKNKVNEYIRKNENLPLDFWDGFYDQSIISVEIRDTVTSLQWQIARLSKMLTTYSYFDKKMNFKWSRKRLSTENSKINNELLDYQQMTKSCIPLKYQGELHLPNGFDLIDNENYYFSKLRTLNEVSLCGDYWGYAQKGSYFFINITIPCNALLMVKVNSDSKRITYPNLLIPEKYENNRNSLRRQIDEVFGSENVKNFLISNSTLKLVDEEIKTVETSDFYSIKTMVSPDIDVF